jgi:flagellar biosynthetic protein FliR
MTLTVAGEPLIAYLLASVRIISWLAIVPPFSSKAVPAMAKVVLALGLAFAVTPGIAGDIPTTFYALTVITLTQVVIGAGMGFVTYLLFQAIATAGSLIDVFGGFQLSQGFDPLGLTMNSVFGKFHQMLATMLLFATGGHLVVIGGLLETFHFLPLGASPHIAQPTQILVTAMSMFFTVGVQIALPMIAVLFIADLGLALMTKVAPQLNAINVMFPAKIGLTLLMVGMCFPVLPEATSRLVDLANQAMAAIAGAG